MNLRPAWATQQDPVSKTKQTSKKESIKERKRKMPRRPVHWD
jgi:hypothetical protein